MARELASPMAAIDSLTVLSTDGAAALPRQVTENLAQTLQMLKGATGVDLQQLVQRATAATAGGSGSPSQAAAPKGAPVDGHRPLDEVAAPAVD